MGMAEERAPIDPLDAPLTRRDFLRALHEMGDAFKQHHNAPGFATVDELHGTAYDIAAERLGRAWSHEPPIAEPPGHR